MLRIGGIWGMESAWNTHSAFARMTIKLLKIFKGYAPETIQAHGYLPAKIHCPIVYSSMTSIAIPLSRFL